MGLFSRTKKAKEEKVVKAELTNKQKQRKRWKDRRDEKMEDGIRIHEDSATKKGAQKGAFGKCKGPFDPSPELTPKQMKSSQQKATARRKARNKRKGKTQDG